MASPVNKARRTSRGNPGSNTGTGDSGLATAAAARLAARTNTPASTPAPVRAATRSIPSGSPIDKSSKTPKARPGASMPVPSNKDLKARLQGAARRRIKQIAGY